MNEFEDKVVLVTGAGRGIGRAIAQAFAAQGAIVAANDITPVNLDETISSISGKGGRASEYIYDIAKKMPVGSLVNHVLSDWGRIDILVNNAAVRPRAPFLELRDWDWQRALDVNLSGPFYSTQAVGKLMSEQGGGAILNMAGAVGAAAGGQATDQEAAFFASKAGLIGLTRAAAQELARYNVRVNAICPGNIRSQEGPGDHQNIRRPQDVAGLALFLCSPAAAFITGQIIHLDGGG